MERGSFSITQRGKIEFRWRLRGAERRPRSRRCRGFLESFIGVIIIRLFLFAILLLLQFLIALALVMGLLPLLLLLLHFFYLYFCYLNLLNKPNNLRYKE